MGSPQRPAAQPWRPLRWAVLVGIGLSAALGAGSWLAATGPLWWSVLVITLAVAPAVVLAHVLANLGLRRDRLQQEEHARALLRQEEEAMLVLGRLAGSLAHEVRNPLHNIRLLVDDLEHTQRSAEGPEPADTAYIIERLKHNTQRINHAVELVYRLARPKDLRLRPESDEHADLIAALEAVRLRLPAEDRLRVVIVARDLKRLPINGDGECLQTVLENLIVNSLRSSGQVPVYIDVAVDADSGKFTVAIFNEGRLSNDFQVPDIDQFDRLRPRQGLGLGIIIVNRLVRQMNMELLWSSDEDVVSFRISGSIHRGLFATVPLTPQAIEEEVPDGSVPRFDR